MKGATRPMVRKLGQCIALVVSLTLLLAPLIGASLARAQDATPQSPLVSCEPEPRPVPESVDLVSAPDESTSKEGLTTIDVGYVPITVVAPLYVAQELGYFADEGLDVQLEAFPGGSDLVILTASGELEASFAGAGPPLYNGIAQDLPVRIIAPGHTEGDPVATPLMISRASCENGTITSVSDLRGKKVSINARGSIEYLLNAALSTGGLTIDDIDLQILPFPDAVAGLESGAIDAALISEPLATKAEQDGIALRLVGSYPLYGMQPTVIIGNESWMNDHPDQAQAFVTGYMRASKLLAEGGLNDPVVQAIIEQYTGVPAALVAASVHPVFSADGQISLDGLATLQSFLRARDQLEYDTDLDPAALIDDRFVTAAMESIDASDS